MKHNPGERPGCVLADPASREEAVLLLVLADGTTGLEADQAIGAANVMPQSLKPLLKVPYRASGCFLHRFPVADKTAVVAIPVRQVTDEERIGVALVVVLDDVEVFRGNEGWAVAAGRQQDVAWPVDLVGRKRLAADALDAPPTLV